MNISVWESASINELIDGLVAGVSVRSTKGLLQGPSILKTSCISAGIFEPDEAKPILRADLTRARCTPVAGSIIISRMNTPALVGEVGYVDRDYPALFLPDRLWLARPKRGRQIDMRWLNYYLSSDEGSGAIRELATGTSGSMKNIPKKRFLGLILPVPSPEEQKRIADVLDDATHMIGILERLIAKKQALKHGLMQQLLTGKVRLPGFSEKWSPHCSLNDTCDRRSGYWGTDQPTSMTNIKMRIIRAGDISPEGRLTGYADRYFSTKERDKAACMAGDVVITASGNGLGKTYYVREANCLAASNFVRILRPRKGVSGEYISYVMQSKAAKIALESHTATSAYPNLLPSFFSDSWFPLPPSSEQAAIAETLRAFDEDLMALQKRLAKARMVKQGMAQKLFTNHTYLPNAEEGA